MLSSAKNPADQNRRGSDTGGVIEGLVFRFFELLLECTQALLLSKEAILINLPIGGIYGVLALLLLPVGLYGWYTGGIELGKE